MSVETMRFENGALHLIDQRVLPLAFETVACRNAAETAEAIRSMVVRGAPAIGCAAAYGVALEAAGAAGQMRPFFDATLEAAVSVLAASRPTARWRASIRLSCRRRAATPSEGGDFGAPRATPAKVGTGFASGVA